MTFLPFVAFFAGAGLSLGNDSQGGDRNGHWRLSRGVFMVALPECIL